MAAPTTTTMGTSTSKSSRPATPLHGAEIVARLRDAFDHGRTRPIEWRLAQLDGIRRMCREREDEIIEALQADMGKPRQEAYVAEMAFVAGEAAYARKHLASWMETDKVATPLAFKPGKSRIHKEPKGVVLVIAPWNYPFQLAIAPMVGALAAGNCVVLKPSELTPAISAVMARRVPEYLDPGAVAVVEGSVAEATDLLEQRWDHIFYTGNPSVGRIVMTAAAKHLTPVTLELGGKCPCIVHGDADLPLTAKRIAIGKWFNAGQTCLAPDYVLAHRAIHDRLIDELSRTLHAFYGDDPQKSPDYTRIVNERHHDRLGKLLGSGEVVVGGKTDRADRYFAPTILKNVSPDSPAMSEEIFGPILPVLPVDDVDEAIRFVNAREKPLALYVFTDSSDVTRRVVERTSSGGVTVNHVALHYLIPELPFGGVGESGMGACHGKASFDTFTHAKSVYHRGTLIDPALQYPPYTPSKLAILKRVL